MEANLDIRATKGMDFVQPEDCYVPDCLFPTDNDWEVPALRLDRQPDFCQIPWLCYGEQKRTFDMGGTGTLHFYTDDYRYGDIYEHPEKILQHHPRNIVEPNFSLFNETPSAFGLQAVYKKRWIARAMQEKGLGVFVDLNVAQKFYKLNLIGIPKGYGSFCTRGYSDRLPALELEYNIAKTIAGDNELLFVCYGGGRECKAFCQSVGAVYVTPIATAKQKDKAWEQLKKDGCIVFTDDDYSVKAIEAAQKAIWDEQVLNFNETKQIGGQNNE